MGHILHQTEFRKIVFVFFINRKRIFTPNKYVVEGYVRGLEELQDGQGGILQMVWDLIQLEL
jgi:hypothetical protein